MNKTILKCHSHSKRTYCNYQEYYTLLPEPSFSWTLFVYPLSNANSSSLYIVDCTITFIDWSFSPPHFCMHVFLCTCEGVYKSVHVHAETRSEDQILSHPPFTLIFETVPFPEPVSTKKIQSEATKLYSSPWFLDKVVFVPMSTSNSWSSYVCLSVLGLLT